MFIKLFTGNVHEGVDGAHRRGNFGISEGVHREQSGRFGAEEHLAGGTQLRSRNRTRNRTIPVRSRVSVDELRFIFIYCYVSFVKFKFKIVL